ncbi:MAG TPA: transglycosylase SLT domain-containing protein [Marinospirillum sp.]|uniref:lytic transglycosylase domain-containing protein n=1 Tax=Marinospirillum sp. TaxID=2183934 RepID=UPI002B48E34A|nr:transglycosylase SLT domain-containing protein [Marinospirillum sp.]HKM14308.1 transglycosylase SLT domain-containing protein [Marinospirillum sp.]
MPKQNIFLPLLRSFTFLSATLLSATCFAQQSTIKESTVEEYDPQFRAIFTQHYEQLRGGELTDLTDTLSQLKNYPLAPYLNYQLLRNQLAYGIADPSNIKYFLANNSNTYLKKNLQAEWLAQLGKAKNWNDFLIETTTNPYPLNAQLACFQITAEAEITGKNVAWQKKATQYWHSNQPLPENCTGLTKQLQPLNLLSNKDYQQTALKLMRQGNATSAKLLQPYLAKKDQQWLNFWLTSRTNPAKNLQALVDKRQTLKTSFAIKDEVLIQLLQQQARSQPSQTLALAKQLHKKRHISQKAFWQIEEYLAIRTAWQGDHAATLQAFAPLPTKALSPLGHEWYARTLLRLADWSQLAKALEHFPKTLLAKSEWRYWQAYALQQTNQPAAANALLKPLAKERHYYGFLAAKALGQALQMNALTTPINPSLVKELSLKTGIKRAAELYVLGFTEEASHEWFQALNQANSADWLQAAWLANQWNWHNLSVDATHKAGVNDALALRFPIAHLETLVPLAAQTNLDLPLVLALIRKESLFNPTARSRVGALGLMQVMPATGKQVSKSLQLKIQPETDLLKPEYNLPIGIHYLAELMQRYDNSPVLAAAAYNAGPTRTSLWQANLGKKIDPLWVERITYGETRDYVKSLLAFREVYAWRLAQLDAPKQPQLADRKSDFN